MINKPIDANLAKQLQPPTLRERSDFEPGQKISENYIALNKAGSGGETHTYCTLRTMFNKDAEKTLNAILPFYSRIHYRNLIKNERTRCKQTAKDENDFSKFCKEFLDGPLDIINKELPQTKPVHCDEDLREIANTTYITRSAFKFLPKENIENDPLSKEDLINEYVLLNTRLNKARDFTELKNGGIGYATNWYDGRTLAEILNKKDGWWKKYRKTNKEFLPPEVSLSILNQAYSEINDMNSKGVFWQDVNLGNIILCFNGNSEIIDYGGIEEITKGKQTLTNNVNEDEFIPPEIFPHIDEKGVLQGHQLPMNLNSPVYSMGVLAYVLFTYQFPIKAVDFEQRKRLSSQHKITNAHAINSECDSDISKFLSDVLQPLPKDRPTIEECEILTGKMLRKYVKDKPPKTVNYNFMQPLQKEITKVYVEQENKNPTPDVVALGSGSKRKRKPQAAISKS